MIARVRGGYWIVSALFALTLCGAEPGGAPGESKSVEVKSVGVDGRVDGEKARLVIEADLKGWGMPRERTIHSVAVQQVVRVTRDKLLHTVALKAEALQGELREVTVALAGDGEIREVTGEGLEDWSVRRATNGTRALVLRLKKGEKPVTVFAGQLTAETIVTAWPRTLTPLSFNAEPVALGTGFIRIDPGAEFQVQATNVAGLVPVDLKYLPEGLRTVPADAGDALAFEFHGSTYHLPLQVAPVDPESAQPVLTDFKLVGRLGNDRATFTLTALARVRNARGGTIRLLSGAAAFTDLKPGTDWRVRLDSGGWVAVFDKAGEYPIRLEFDAARRLTNGWNEVEFAVAPSAPAPVTFEGLKADTQFRFAGAARPERSGSVFASYLPPNGEVRLAWKEARAEAEGALFYAAEGLTQVAVSPGLMQQTVLLDFKVMQGEMNRVALRLLGTGEVTRVQGSQVLGWTVEAVPDSKERRLVVQLNQARKDQFGLQVQLQTTLGAFPQAVEAVQVRPEGATRFGGYFRVVNEGAVRLEVVEASGLSQVSPDQFPATEATKGLLPAQTTQGFAFRFSGGPYQLRVQADNILPELAVSELLAYHLGETELAIDAELEVDVREAPLRELLVRAPKGYVVARLNAGGLSDYFVTEPVEGNEALLRLVYGTPVIGRQVVQLRLERNKPLGEAVWRLPRVDVAKAKSVRGHLAVSADAGFRVTPATVQGLTDLATAFFPKKLAGIQAAFRLSDAAWQATLNVERLPQSIQVDGFHLFSVGEGIAYGSSVLNYVISGAPIGAFKVELSPEYYNVEFTGKEVRNWQKVEGGFLVQLHTPVSGAYTLLATYERPFKAQGEKLGFAGARPLDAQSEQGHTLVISAYQFQVKPVNLSSGLLPLEPGEVPAEYRLFFDAPILAAYRYVARPFSLELELKPLDQAETVGQVVDRAALTTRISEEGQVVTEGRYFIKNKGAPNLRVVLPEGSVLWSVMVNGSAVVPVTKDRANLIPLPQRADADSVSVLELKIASRARNGDLLALAAPAIGAPVLLAEWRLIPEAHRRLEFRSGTVAPVKASVDRSGFAALMQALRGPQRGQLWGVAGLVLLLMAVAGWMWRLATAPGVPRFSLRHVAGGILGLAVVGLAVAVILQALDIIKPPPVPNETGLRLVAPVQQADTTFEVQVRNVAVDRSPIAPLWGLWMVALAFLAWLVAAVRWGLGFGRWSRALAWTLVLWGTLHWPNGAPAAVWTGLAFLLLEVVLPWLRRWWQQPAASPTPAGGPGDSSGAAAPVVAVLMLGFGCLAPDQARAQTTPGAPPIGPGRAEAILQQIRVEENYAIANARVQWTALKGQLLPLLHEPGVLTRATVTGEGARLVQVGAAEGRQQSVAADKAGPVEIELEYQVPVVTREGVRGFPLPTFPGLVNRIDLTLVGLDVDVTAAAAVSAQRTDVPGSTNTVAALVLAPAPDAWIGWKPRSRDTRREKAVFYADWVQLYVASAGVVEGVHQVQLRPAQGELDELVFEAPQGSTITDVLSPLVSLWRFDPESRLLRVRFTPAQSKPVAVTIRSQIATGPLPLTQSVGLMAVRQAADQLGLAGVATGSEVQLDDVQIEGLTAINLEDFPAGPAEPLKAQVAGLALRRAFRYSDPKGALVVKASAVEPDVRVESAQTLSLGEDRTVLGANLEAEITRAGIFKLSFVLPAGLDVESVTGAALSHWTEFKTDAGRVITLHLKGKTEGKQPFALTLSGSGVRSAQGWTVPRLVLREATKQQGQLLVVPEQGLRLQVGTREGVTQLDPLKTGVRQKGVLAFRLLQREWRLALDLERVDAWTQVTSLQQVTVGEAQVKIAANLQYEIENTGAKALRVRLPANAEGVRFRGEQVADFLPREGQTNGALREWEVKLHRRVIGRYLLQVNYSVPLPERATDVGIAGVEAQEVNLQRGFLTVQSAGRLQVRVETLPPALQPAEWQSIPRTLQPEAAAAANYTYRLVEPGFVLPLRLERHAAAQLLPARVNSVTLTSALSDDGVLLTQVRMQLVPGDKRLLRFTLPEPAKFWFAFVNRNSVWPWRETNQVLLPLAAASKQGEPTTVEFWYSTRAPGAAVRSLDLDLDGPRFDLPLENITWRMYAGERWRLKHSSGSLQFQGEGETSSPVAVDVETYMNSEASLLKAKTVEAEQFLSTANRLLEQGDPGEARRAFQAAYGLSQHDNAFNEDARVQLHNLKMQQALVGLNVRQAKVAGEPAAIAGAPRGLREGQTATYTQAEAKQLFERNTAEDNAVQMRLAERLIQQQDAATANPAAIRANIPEQGRVWTFTRALEVNNWADLKLRLEARAGSPDGLGGRALVLLGAFAGLCLLLVAGRFGATR